MKTKIYYLIAGVAMTFITQNTSAQGTVPELIYYKFDQTGTVVNNDASSPPAGSGTGTINGLTQGGTGLCGGALIGNGGSSSTNYVSTGWNTNLGSNAWTIAFWTNNIPSSSTLFYQFGDAGATSFRCFTNGVAGAGNFMLRGPFTDVTCTGCAPINAPSMTVFVYDPTAGNIKAYHDGVLNSTVTQSSFNLSGSGLTVGGYTSSTSLASGQLMDDFRFYDRALDAQEVFDTYNACLPLV
ncbi:MAG: LamG-like jellyroll fold domain-containing protein, partial [Bacteroidota bacterium]